MSDEQKLQLWVAEQLKTTTDKLQWQPLSGDASFRRYFRCQPDSVSYIAALAPPATEKNHEFVHISQLLESVGVRVPHVLAVNYEHGYLLQNDFGDALLRQQLNDNSVDQWYRLAMQQMQQMLTMSEQQLNSLLPYDTKALQLELSYFTTWFLQAMLNYHCDAVEEARLNRFFAELLASAAEQPQKFVHRDYHSRNIMVVNGELAAIDFQDALRGPITYDPVSLFRDCYVVWPEQKVRGWVAQYWRMLSEKNIVAVSEAVFQRWFDLMSLQRHIKVLGIFARLSIRDNKHGYLHDLPTVVRYVQQVSAQHEEAREFHNWFSSVILPLARQQSWGAGL